MWHIHSTAAATLKRFRGGLIFKAHRLLHHSTLGFRVIKKKKAVTLIASFTEVPKYGMSTFAFLGFMVYGVQGYLPYKKRHPPRTLP